MAKALKLVYLLLILPVWLAAAFLINLADTLANGAGLALIGAYSVLGYGLYLRNPLQDLRYRWLRSRSEALRRQIDHFEQPPSSEPASPPDAPRRPSP